MAASRPSAAKNEVKVMKIKWFCCALFFASFLNVNAQSDYTVTERGADYKVMQKTVVENGVTNVHRYTELATGMNYTNSLGQWTEAQEQITILPTGGAEAIQGRHQVYFPADIYDGVLEVVTPDGRHLQSRPLGVSYDDGSNTVFIATLKDAVGYLTSSNQVTYRDAFTGFKADLVCTYRRGGFECDLVFRQQPPTPDQYGLDSSFTTLELVTEFFNTQDPEQIPGASDDWFGLQDSTLKFGKLTMTHGKAFAFKGTNALPSTINSQLSTPVYKSWVHADGRTFLIETVPVLDIAEALDALPLTARNERSTTNLLSSLVTPHSSLALHFPPSHQLTADTNQILLAAADFKKEPGVVLDYNEVSDQTDYDFQPGTYYVSGAVNLDGLVTFEGGAVVKFAPDPSVGINLNTTNIVCTTTPDSPVIFTAKDDDSVGNMILGSNGSPTNYYNGGDIDPEEWSGAYGNGLILTAQNGVSFQLSNFKFYYLGTAVQCYWGDSASWQKSVLTLINVQAFYCDVAVESAGVCYQLLDGLFANDNTVWFGSDTIGSAEQVTVADCNWFGLPNDGGGSSLHVTNCLIVATANFDSDLSYETNYTVTLNSAAGVFQTAANGNYYLATTSLYRNAGTTDIDPDLLAELQTTTTYAPADGGYPDGDGLPDLGYHYPLTQTNWPTSFTVVGTRHDADYTVGCQLVVGSSNLVVSALARYNCNATNAQTHRVGLWDAAHNLIASNSFNVAGQPVGWQYLPLASNVVLQAGGTYYLGSEEFLNGDTWADDNCTFTETAAATVTASRFVYGSFAFPSYMGNTNAHMYVGLSFEYIFQTPYSETRAASVALADVQQAVNKTANGGTVLVPAGITNWNGTLTLTNDLTILGAGIGQTIITNNVASFMISWTTISNSTCRLSGFQFEGGSGSAGLNYRTVSVDGTCHAFRLDHCQFDNLANYNVWTAGWVYGVADDCTFNFNTTASVAFEVQDDAYGGYSYGDGSWADDDYLGTTNNFYIETCNFTGPTNAVTFMLDGVLGSRAVVRYCNITNCVVQSHGTDNGGRRRGFRLTEVYNNNFILQTNAPSGSPPYAFAEAIYVRSGSSTVFSNVVSGGFEYLVGPDNYRPFPAAWPPFTNSMSVNCTGVNPWDSNNPTLFTNGTATVTNNSFTLSDSTQNWITNQWASPTNPFVLYDINQKVGAIITANTKTNITYAGKMNGFTGYFYTNYYTTPASDAPAFPNGFMIISNGESYQIRQLMATLDQAGFGKGDLITNDPPVNSVTGTASWPNEVPDPIYIWANKFTFLVGGYSTGIGGPLPNCVIFTNTPRPGYSPLIYPHPLVR